MYKSIFNSCLGKIFLVFEGEFLIGLYFENQKYFPFEKISSLKEKITDASNTVKNWLDMYFKGVEPDFIPKIKLTGTDFQKEVFEILKTIPYGKTMTYGEIAKTIAKKRCLDKMSNRAIGSAVGKNPISIIIPCHRVVGKNNFLTGYAAGIEKKKFLLELEGIGQLEP